MTPERTPDGRSVVVDGRRWRARGAKVALGRRRKPWWERGGERT